MCGVSHRPQWRLGNRLPREWSVPGRHRWRTGSHRCRSILTLYLPPRRGCLGDGFGPANADAPAAAPVLVVVPEDFRAAWMTQLAQCGRPDLPDPLAGQAHAPANLLESARLIVDQAKTQLNNPPLARAQRCQDVLDLIAEHRLAGRLERCHRHLVLDEIAQVGIFFLADRRFEGHWLLRNLLQLLDLVDRDAHAVGELLFARLPAELLEQGPRHARQLIEGVNHVDRDADRPRLVRDGARDRLADPPGRVGRELEAALVVELLDRAHQPQVPFLDQVEERQAPVEVLLGNRDHQAEVRLGEVMACLFRAGFHLLRQLNLFLSREQVDASNLLEVHPDRVVEGHRADHLDLREDFLFILVLLGLGVRRDRDAHFLEGRGDAHEAVCVTLDRRKRLDYVVRGQVALILPLEDQRFRAQYQRVYLNPRFYLGHSRFLPIS